MTWAGTHRPSPPVAKATTPWDAARSPMSYDRIPKDFPVLLGEGMLLRELAEEDLPAWFARLSDVEAAALAGDPVAASINDVIAALEYHRNAFRVTEGIRWAIVPLEVGASVGSIGFAKLDQAKRSAELGYAIGRQHWDRGFATRAGRLALDYGFKTLDFKRVEALVMTSNAASIRVLQKLGFARRGILEAYRMVNGIPWDFILYSMSSDSREAEPSRGSMIAGEAFFSA